MRSHFLLQFFGAALNWILFLTSFTICRSRKEKKQTFRIKNRNRIIEFYAKTNTSGVLHILWPNFNNTTCFVSSIYIVWFGLFGIPECTWFRLEKISSCLTIFLFCIILLDYKKKPRPFIFI